MAKRNKKWWYILLLLAFVAYTFIAARPITRETVLQPRWISSLELGQPVNLEQFSGQGDGSLLPFSLGERFGYVGDDGSFAINQIRRANISLSDNAWAEYESLPSGVQVLNPRNETLVNIENINGYPLFLDNRMFLLGVEQSSIIALGPGGEELWTYDFPAPVTFIDGSNGHILAGTVDGAVILLGPSGIPLFSPFEPGGSRLSVILGGAISRDASRLAIISGIDEQRFLLMERSGDIYRVIYHEFLGEGFRRPVHISFVDNDSKVAFERIGGLGIYDIYTRNAVTLDLDGELIILDNSGGDRFLFLISSPAPGEKRFITIRYPGTIVSEAPFTSENAFFARRNNKLYLGGDTAMISFELERR